MNKNFWIEFADRYAQCDMCKGVGGVVKVHYVVRNYESPKTKRICQKLQKHYREVWICRNCLDGVRVEVESNKEKFNSWYEKQRADMRGEQDE